LLKEQSKTREEFSLETEIVQTKEAPSRMKILIIGFILVLILITSLILVLYSYTQDRGVFHTPVKIGEVNLLGLTLEEGKQALERSLNTELQKAITFEIPGIQQNLQLKLIDLGLVYNLNEVLDKAWNIGREGNLFRKALSKFKARSSSIISLQAKWDGQAIKNTLEKTFQSFRLTPKDATFDITDDNQMRIHPEQLGREFDFEALSQEIKKINLKQTPLPTLTVPIKTTLEPYITASKLEAIKITGPLARYTTNFDGSQINRSENIRLAAKALDKKLLAPDEQFSFNSTVGERTAKAGYKEALIIEGNTFTPGLGGGVCQVSSTLYNALTIANLKITERHPHSLPVNYVPPGRDATVSYGVLDLKFKNTSGGYLLIRSSVQGNSITFELYGKTKYSS
jgi:vancomycin resistance protein YoaR